MDDQLTWEDLDEDRGLLALFERGPAAEGDESRYVPVPHLRIVVEGETFIALLDPRLEGVEEALFDDVISRAFIATDAYDAIDKALKIRRNDG